MKEKDLPKFGHVIDLACNGPDHSWLNGHECVDRIASKDRDSAKELTVS